ncbi:MAG: hypothetical protein RQM92_03405 [Candidatus Syntrophopropionicum ammoniitolerans]
MRFILYPLLLGIVILLQSTVLGNIAIAGAKPDLVMLIVVLSSFVAGARDKGLFGIHRWDCRGFVFRKLYWLKCPGENDRRVFGGCCWEAAFIEKTP